MSLPDIKNTILREVRHLEPHIIEKRMRGKKNFFIALIIGIIIILVSLIINLLFNLSYQERVIIALFLIIVYAIVLFFMTERKIIREIHHKEIHTYERPVYHHIVHKVEKPIPVENLVFIEKENIAEKENIKKEKPKAPYVGSSQTRVYHLRSCRFAGMIKPKFIKEEFDKKWFDRKGYKPCENCLGKNKIS